MDGRKIGSTPPPAGRRNRPTDRDKEKPMQPQFVDEPAFTVVGLAIHTKPITPELPNRWQQFGPRMDEVKHLAEPNVAYGLMDHFDHTRGELDYMAGESVEQAGDLPAGMVSWSVPANTYAVFESTLSTIGQTFDHIYNRW